MTKYLGIDIDYSRDGLITPFAMDTLRERYMWTGKLDTSAVPDFAKHNGGEVDERSPQESYARVAVYAATFNRITDYGLAQRLYDACSKQHFGWSTPLLSNGGTTRGLPISCFLQFVPDSMDGISNHWRESAALASKGGGLGAFHGALRTSGTPTSKGSKSNGMLPFLKVSDSQMAAVSQGTTRRGAYASYLPISHPEIKYFINMRKNDGGDIDRKCLNLHHGVVISDDFMRIIERLRDDSHYDDSWDLIDPHTRQVVETVSAGELWEAILNLRAGAGKGEPYIMFGDTVSDGVHPDHKAEGLGVVQSNLCTEITLPTNEERTAVCCLSSVNLATFNQWHASSLVFDLTVALDNVLDHYIAHAAPSMRGDYPRPRTFNEFSKHVLKNKKAFAKSAYSAYMERSIGIGAMGFHTALQRVGIPFESPMAISMNRRMFEHIRNEAEVATHYLADRRGRCPDALTEERRNMYTIAIAPTATNSIICGGVSPCIEPWVSNVFTHKTDSGNYTVINPQLVNELVAQGFEGKELEAVLTKVRAAQGSVLHIEEIPEHVREVYKTASEIDQQWVVQHAADRQQYVDQAQSVNLFFSPSLWGDDKEGYTNYFEAVHFQAWKKRLKTLYYCRTDAKRRATVNAPIKFEVNDEECLACQ